MKPFRKPHAIRGSYSDPRFHLDAEGALSSFHFGVDIAVPDGTAVYAVEAGRVVDRRGSAVTVLRHSGRGFGYWHIKPVVRRGQHVHKHQLLGHVIKGWGHVHFAEAFRGQYRNPLRKGGLTPFYDRTIPTVASVVLLGADGAPVSPAHVDGSISIEANVYDTPPIAPRPPWQVARLAPESIWWELRRSSGALVQSDLAVYFGLGLPPNDLYNWIYAPGTYQNKPFRPGNYAFWLAHGFDTTDLPDGTYTLGVYASDTRGNIGSRTVDLAIDNGPEPQSVQPPAHPGAGSSG